jgi:hypothetical protein
MRREVERAVDVCTAGAVKLTVPNFAQENEVLTAENTIPWEKFAETSLVRPVSLGVFFEAMVSLNSLPQLAGCQSGALRQRVEFCKGETGIGEMAQTAIGAGNDVFFAD